ncbi:MAG TPA: FKBP-type peptidyl-prolyl cis-trans isomerase, partial [Thermoanaerobaculia bacterium]|nr:FKBP-type peptidyl-prolyl cis-trans isomerase [Thermoanaerobaculia bacterium]
DRMIPEWRDAVRTMVAGDKRTVRTAEYDIETELLEVIKGPETPADLTAPPADAEKTRSGLAHKVLREGTGTTKPRRRSTVRVNYSGWNGEGRLFDSTILRGQPAEFRLENVIAGWTEGLQLMVEGEVRRFWIPAKLAYEGSPDKPQGMLVFDIELVEVK